MNSDKILWCARQAGGIKLVQQKPHLSESYMKEADETLDVALQISGKWKIITAYYACYNALYSLLMKAGVQCEIHDCTIEVMALFGFEQKEIKFMAELKEDRIQTQYYLKEKELKNEVAVKMFVSKCKVLLDSLNSENIEKIRARIKNIVSRI